jgi:hypothetical protein
LYGAVLAGALGACDELLDREDSPEVELPEVESVVELWDQARDGRDGLSLSVGRLGEAVWIYGACLDRDAALLPDGGEEAARGNGVGGAGARGRG